MYGCDFLRYHHIQGPKIQQRVMISSRYEDAFRTNGDIAVHVLYKGQPPGAKKGFVKGEALSRTPWHELFKQKKLKKTLPHLKNTLYREAIHKTLLTTHSQRRNFKKGHKPSSCNETKQKNESCPS